MIQQDLLKLTSYLRNKFGNQDINLKLSKSDADMAEVYIASEFIGTIYRDEDEGEISYDFNMSIIDIDLE
ncbi:MAG: DUF3126 family protein [Alphaproteobacteria bacterium]|nr:DUF3126 family protein [Alphaproteobacteria bacterium]MBQ8660100.1 DUF3126 family protein [Alphaproteobacteria bacterium]MBR4315888.1 DUF3126 family protein [Alphaproteobacteria bacterium]